MLLSLLLLSQIQLSQNPVTGNCRLTPDQLTPIIPAFFPYLYRYEWDNQNKLETLWLSSGVRLQIQQRACIRHHITYELRLPASYPLPQGFTQGLMGMLDTLLTLIYRDNFSFLALKTEIWPKLMQQAALRSLGEIIMLHAQEWSFLLRLDQRDGFSTATLETIRYISSQSVQRPGVPDYMDDGWSP
ncbi:MAG: hypothetical protein NZ958_04840 [Bacteroidia bacterium]|nr:hypothetical protein [Bacteroidia bacterium]MDW8088915.1 hypothetical protein [Bacteroidia bacterium]